MDRILPGDDWRMCHDWRLKVPNGIGMLHSCIAIEGAFGRNSGEARKSRRGDGRPRFESGRRPSCSQLSLRAMTSSAVNGR